MAVLDWSQCPAVESVPGRLGGAWVFRDTRMPVSAVFHNLEAGANINEIIEQFDLTLRTDKRSAGVCRERSRCSGFRSSLMHEMMILSDHVTPRGIARCLPDHTVVTARERDGIR